MKKILLAVFVLTYLKPFAQNGIEKTITTTLFDSIAKLPYELDSSGSKKYYSLDSLNNKLYYSLQIESSFKGGPAAWIKFLERTLKVNNVRKKIKKDDIPEDGLRVSADLVFTVCKDGSLCDFEVVNDAPSAVKEEVIRVIKLSPNWIPGVQNDVSVKSKKKQKITFIITK